MFLLAGRFQLLGQQAKRGKDGLAGSHFPPLLLRHTARGLLHFPTHCCDRATTSHVFPACSSASCSTWLMWDCRVAGSCLCPSPIRMFQVRALLVLCNAGPPASHPTLLKFQDPQTS